MTRQRARARPVRAWLRDHPRRVTICLVAAYAAIVSWLSLHHEPWRDEVVPLSMVREAHSLVDLWHMVRPQGHPMLWYLCLRWAWLGLGSTAALKIVSVLVAIVAMAIFLVRAPLPLWLKCLFTFSWLPIYEYSVVARMYGLGMLWLFAFCALYERRGEHPVALALTLVALANTHALGFFMAVAAGAMLLVDTVTGRGPIRPAHDRWHAAGVAVYVAGLAFCVITIIPDPGSALEVYNQDLKSLVLGVVTTLLMPAGHTYFLLGFAPSLWIWMYLLTLVRRPALLCFAALSLFSFELMFTLVLPPNQHRIGYILLVVLATLWLDLSQPVEPPTPSSRWDRALPRIRRFLLVPLVATLLLHVALGVHHALTDLGGDYSSSRRLATLIERDPRLAGAIVVGEPERRLESLPYYVSNRIYIAQEGVFRPWVQIVKGRPLDQTLSALLDAARQVRDRYESPVVIVLGWSLDGPEVQRINEGTVGQATFRTTAAAKAEFLRQTERLASFRDATLTDENYDVYVVW